MWVSRTDGVREEITRRDVKRERRKSSSTRRGEQHRLNRLNTLMLVSPHERMTAHHVSIVSEFVYPICARVCICGCSSFSAWFGSTVKKRQKKTRLASGLDTLNLIPPHYPCYSSLRGFCEMLNISSCRILILDIHISSSTGDICQNVEMSVQVLLKHLSHVSSS